jgi:hypothetical protein
MQGATAQSEDQRLYLVGNLFVVSFVFYFHKVKGKLGKQSGEFDERFGNVR